MKKLILLCVFSLVILQLNCIDNSNLNGTNVSLYKDNIDIDDDVIKKLPDLIIHINCYEIGKNNTKVFATVQNLGGYDFSYGLTVVKLNINNYTYQAYYAIKNLTETKIFNIVILTPVINIDNMFAVVDVSNVIDESNENNNISNIIIID